MTFTLDLLADKRDKHPDVVVCGEIYIPVKHCLLGRNGPSSTSSVDRWEASRLFPTALPGRTLNTTSGPNGPSNLQVTSPDSAGGVTPTLTSPYPASAACKPATSLKHISKLYSHPQAWGQCKTFMSQYLKGIDRIDTSSTSAAAAAVANDETGSSAAVCSALAAKIYGLDVLAHGVEDSQGNTTRFFVIRRDDGQTETSIPRRTTSQRTRRRSSVSRPTTRTGQGWDPSRPGSRTAEDGQGARKYKSCVAFTVPHAGTHAGALANTLSVFAGQGINLTSINTRPSGWCKWHYIFFLEFDGRAGDGGAVDEALRRVDEMVCGSRRAGAPRGGGNKIKSDGNEEGQGTGAWWRLIGSWESNA